MALPAPYSVDEDVPAPFGRWSPALSSLAAAAPDLALGFTFLAAWVRPESFHGPIIERLLMVMLLEFIIIHSSAFMGTVMFSPKRDASMIQGAVGIGGFYSLFVGAFSLAFHSWWPLASFWALTLNRLLAAFVGRAPDAEQKARIQRGWAVGVLCYIVYVGVTIVLPVPRLGVTGAVLAAHKLPGSGEWVSEPWRMLAFGALYFTTVGLSEMFDHRWLPDSTIRSGPAGSR